MAIQHVKSGFFYFYEILLLIYNIIKNINQIINIQYAVTYNIKEYILIMYLPNKNKCEV